MKKEELALLLNGRQYSNEISEKEKQIAKKNGLIVIFGASDDLVEFAGALFDEIGAYDGTDFIIATPGTEIMIDEIDELTKQEKIVKKLTKLQKDFEKDGVFIDVPLVLPKTRIFVKNGLNKDEVIKRFLSRKKSIKI